MKFSVCLTAGLLGSFLLERLLSGVLQDNDDSIPAVLPPQSQYLHHNHELRQASGAPLIANILFGGAIHSFIDGVAIATGFIASHELGVAATIAVLLHEVPHHVADVGVLIFGGLSKMKAVLWNALAGCTCLLGGAVVFLLGRYVSNLSTYLLPITAGNFLYIATAILMPELQKEEDRWRSLEQVFCLVAGLVLMFGLSSLIRG